MSENDRPLYRQRSSNSPCRHIILLFSLTKPFDVSAGALLEAVKAVGVTHGSYLLGQLNLYCIHPSSKPQAFMLLNQYITDNGLNLNVPANELLAFALFMSHETTADGRNFWHDFHSDSVAYCKRMLRQQESIWRTSQAGSSPSSSIDSSDTKNESTDADKGTVAVEQLSTVLLDADRANTAAYSSTAAAALQLKPDTISASCVGGLPGIQCHKDLNKNDATKTGATPPPVIYNYHAGSFAAGSHNILNYYGTNGPAQRKKDD